MQPSCHSAEHTETTVEEEEEEALQTMVRVWYNGGEGGGRALFLKAKTTTTLGTVLHLRQEEKEIRTRRYEHP